MMGGRSSKPAASPAAQFAQRQPPQSGGAAAVAQEEIRHEYFYLSMPSEIYQDPLPSFCEKVRGAFLLSALGDAFGFNNSQFEHCTDYSKMLAEIARRGGMPVTNSKSFKVSDETIMALATARVLSLKPLSHKVTTLDDTLTNFAIEYHNSFGECNGRSLDQVTSGAYRVVCPVKGCYRPKDQEFHTENTSCGAATRAWPIGIRFSRPDEFIHLLEYSIDNGRITHHHPIGFVGAFAAAFFMQCAISRMHTSQWGKYLLDVMPHIRHYIESTNRHVDQNLKAMGLFEETLARYLEARGILSGLTLPNFPDPNGAAQCNEAYKYLAQFGRVNTTADPLPGSEGHHCVLIAYDAVLTAMSLGLGGTKKGWICVLERSTMHCGDSDGTGAIAGALWGALWGVNGVPAVHIDNIEFRLRLLEAADELVISSGYPLDPPLMLYPIRRGAEVLLEAAQYADGAVEKIQAGESPKNFELRLSAYNEEITKLSIQMDGLEEVTEAERVERRRLLKSFDFLENKLKFAARGEHPPQQYLE